MSNLNDFYLLHGVTASWSLKKVLEVFEGAELELRRKVVNSSVRAFLFGLFYVYIQLECPAVAERKAELRSWDELIAKTLTSPENDEHVFKMVQVM